MCRARPARAFDFSSENSMAHTYGHNTCATRRTRHHTTHAHPRHEMQKRTSSAKIRCSQNTQDSETFSHDNGSRRDDGALFLHEQRMYQSRFSFEYRCRVVCLRIRPSGDCARDLAQQRPPARENPNPHLAQIHRIRTRSSALRHPPQPAVFFPFPR